MATPYLDRAGLEALLGTGTVERIASDTDANIDAVIQAQCAVADGYVASQVTLPPNPLAMAQVAPIVAELVYCALYIGSGLDVSPRRTAALKQLQDIAVKPPRMVLFCPALVDDPATAADESNTGADSGSSADRWFTRDKLQRPDALYSQVW